MLRNLSQHIVRCIIKNKGYKLILLGLRNTLIMSFFSIILGIIIGTFVATIREIIKQSKRKHIILNFICNFYVNVTRAMPAVVRLLLIYYFFFSNIKVNNIIIGIVAFGFGSGAFIAEIIRSGINSVDKSQIESAKILGLSYLQIMRYIVLPQTIKNMLPAFGNELIALIIETSIAGYIGITDLTRSASIISSRTFDYLIPLLLVAALYMLIIFGLKWIMNKFEKRLKYD